ncbi:conserved hypothetical protein [Paracholeplasma brassicae]|uniref:Uncharacterized protein n=2 Tax=Acholeplasma brassicae TaxID=61635 RepID=U4KNV4_9MOLU|nr:conserved hypothetical protein [Paracholeplasma brassicae]
MYEVKDRLKTSKFMLVGLLFFSFFIGIYTTLDYFNGGYAKMVSDYGTYLVIINVILNVVMALVSALMFNLSTALFDVTKKEGKGTFMTMVSVLFGVLTYGCTSCVISFFAVIGITFSVAVLPFAGLPYKLLSLVILAIGFLWLLKEVKNAKCKI